MKEVRFDETPTSRDGHDSPGFEPDEDIHHNAHAVLKCDRSSCSGIVHAVGRGYVDREIHQDGQDYDWVQFIEVEYFAPPLRLISFPALCPEDVCAEIQQTFSIFWADPSSAGNKLRVAIEKLLTRQRVAQHTTSKKGKRVRLNLNARIDAWKKEKLRTELHAIRWIGNSGSHDGELTRSDVLDGLEILERVLSELFDGNAKRIAAITSQIRKRKKPRSVKRIKKAPKRTSWLE